MSTDPLKSIWNTGTYENRDIRVKSPVLRDIRRQLTLETVSYTLFLLVYYNFFDGDKKSLILNVILVVAVLLLLVHNITGYYLSDRVVEDDNLRQSLAIRLQQLKRYAVISVASRVLAFAGIMLFFMGNITFTGWKYGALAVIIGILMVQVYLLAKVWIKRISKIKTAYTNL